MTDYNRDSPPVIPLLDTWGWNRGGVDYFWAVDPPAFRELSRSSTSEQKNLITQTLQKSFHAFKGIMRPWEISIVPPSLNETPAQRYVWNPNCFSNDNFISQAIESIQSYPAPIGELSVKLDVFVYVRTPASPTCPIRAWVRYFSEDSPTPMTQFSIYIGSDMKLTSTILDINATLFKPFTNAYGDNEELHSLNQPFLEQALRQWEAEFGSIEAEGSGYKYGFRVD